MNAYLISPYWIASHRRMFTLMWCDMHVMRYDAPFFKTSTKFSRNNSECVRVRVRMICMRFSRETSILLPITCVIASVTIFKFIRMGFVYEHTKPNQNEREWDDYLLKNLFIFIHTQIFASTIFEYNISNALLKTPRQQPESHIKQHILCE